MGENESRATRNTIIIVSFTVGLAVLSGALASNQMSHTEMKDETKEIRSELALKLSIDEYREDQKDDRLRFGVIEQKLDKILDIMTFYSGKTTQHKPHVVK